MKKYQKPVDKAEEAYWKEIERIADLAFEEKIQPWLERHNYSFLAGNGKWSVFDENNEAIEEDNLPKTIRSTLEIGLLNRTIDLGCLMPIWKPPRKPATGKYSHKPYRCTVCGTEKQEGTNHWGSIYPYCYECQKITIWECLEPVPEGYDIPEPWKLVKLGYIAEIKTIHTRKEK